MTIAQCRSARRKMKMRYGEKNRFGDIHAAIERERERAAREQNRKKAKK